MLKFLILQNYLNYRLNSSYKINIFLQSIDKMLQDSTPNLYKTQYVTI